MHGEIMGMALKRVAELVLAMRLCTVAARDGTVISMILRE